MYYVVLEDSGKIVGARVRMSDEIIQSEANEFGEAVYVIEGEHSGYSAEPQAATDAPTGELP